MDSTIPQPEPRSNKLEVSLEVFEDVVEELEDFVYLARLGYTHEAHIQYEEALRSHQDRWCPILIEYIDMLLSTGYLTEASTMLQRYRQHHFDGAINHHYRLVLESMLELVDDETYKRRYSKMSSEGIRKEVMYIAGELDGITESACRDGDFIIPTYHRLEITLIAHVKHLQGQESIDGIPYKRICKNLMQMSRYWEAYNLLRAIRTSLSIEVALQFFDFFFIGISEHLSNQAAKLAYLAAMIEMLDFIHECRQHDYAELRILLKEKASDLIEFPQRIIDEAEELLIYFFDDLEHASGLLFERWHRRAIYFVDQERDRLVAESIQEQDEVMGSGLPVPDRRPKLKLPSKYNVLEKLDKDKTATYKIYDTP